MAFDAFYLVVEEEESGRFSATQVEEADCRNGDLFRICARFFPVTRIRADLWPRGQVDIGIIRVGK